MRICLHRRRSLSQKVCEGLLQSPFIRAFVVVPTTSSCTVTSSSGIMSSLYAVDDILFKNALAALPAKLLESMQKAGLTDPGILRRYPRYSSDELMIVSSPVSPSTGQASSGVESATVAVVATKAAGFVDQSSAVERKDAVQNVVIDSPKDSAETAVTDARAVPMVQNIVRDEFP